MKIDRRYGTWDLKDATLLDNIAYQIYLNKHKYLCDKQTLRKYLSYRSSQQDFDRLYKNGDFYKEANLILRKEKIEKIKSRINK